MLLLCCCWWCGSRGDGGVVVVAVVIGDDVVVVVDGGGVVVSVVAEKTLPSVSDRLAENFRNQSFLQYVFQSTITTSHLLTIINSNTSDHNKRQHLSRAEVLWHHGCLVIFLTIVCSKVVHQSN